MAAIGRPQYINLRQAPQPEQAFDRAAFQRAGWEVLDAAYAAGIRYFDTAPGYGLAEELLIDWLAEQDDPTIEVATKWGYTYTANFDPQAEQHEVKEHSLAKLNEQWQQSKRLLPRLSTYQIHSATFESGVLENEAVLIQLAALKAEHGLHIGLSTSGANHLEVLRAAKDIAVAGVRLFDAFQVTYNLLDQGLAALADDLHAAGQRLLIKEALANGRLFPNPDYPNYQELYQRLLELAHQYDVGVDAIALRFCIDSLRPYRVLSGAATVEHVQQNSRVREFQLTEEDIERLKGFAMAPAAYWAERKELDWQ